MRPECLRPMAGKLIDDREGKQPSIGLSPMLGG